MLVLDYVFVKKLYKQTMHQWKSNENKMNGKMFKFTLMTMTDNWQILIRKDHLKAISTDFLDINYQYNVPLPKRKFLK